MQQRDILQDEIEELGRVLGRILATFLGWQSEGDPVRGTQMANEQLASELDVSVEQLLALDEQALREYLTTRNWTPAHMEALAQYLAAAGTEKMHTDRAEAERYVQTALRLLDIADDQSATLSFERMSLRGDIEGLLG
ncbi:hypothetical protein [Lewinella sp. IMCC34191]|uniref:hypothetical protein n=1 Tax=Lewinella sp. IMCC34191 TaxID=2259172 RepID=UPI000E23CEFD|nr:hypothetical protein [Lewinella sp. IMCC34191]